ncbi:hypothetical protein WDA79_04755 [Streptomyces sp. A475]|uniref:hypothetical protein n=1 Tax=unclassified Streptomyces TaxID=2593676 RepID=UPI0030CA0E3F
MPADRRTEAGTGPASAEPGDPTFATAGCPDLSARTSVAAICILFMADGVEPAEPAAMQERFDATPEEYERPSGRLARHVTVE